MRNAGKIITVVAAALSLGACTNSEQASDLPPGSGPTPSVGQPAASSSASAPSSGNVSTEPEGQKECTAEDIKVTGAAGAPPEITIPATCKPPTKRLSKDLTPGTGAEAKAGSQLEMNYLLVSWSDKEKKDSSFDRGEPFPLSLGEGSVIKGWDEGLVGIKQGARRLLVIPPAEGYGPNGKGTIKPNETLVFIVDAVKVA
ncbi:FKBP-type peptidyl-prolyl cis-trans isomerase [Amycolatopsis nigrescens]|uniref:FKBP-type peptidyl-prolyl cis-trans isomerase n=1 Tax=Amycolatopsis nigrescens TaxID=381445 RepID=UPI0004780F9A|nr:FKBP-type peptidyl-prolyl cis-trans isomerase [Amycolatopsis nigrescens]